MNNNFTTVNDKPWLPAERVCATITQPSCSPSAEFQYTIPNPGSKFLVRLKVNPNAGHVLAKVQCRFLIEVYMSKLEISEFYSV